MYDCSVELVLGDGGGGGGRGGGGCSRLGDDAGTLRTCVLRLASALLVRASPTSRALLV